MSRIPLPMTDEEKFRFDLQGFLVLRGVLSEGECERLQTLAEQAWPRSAADAPFRRGSCVSRWGKPFLDLIDHPRVLPYLVQLVGSRIRIDHDYSIYMRRGAAPNPLHGGPHLGETDHWYRYQDGVMRNGLTVATWNLTDAGPGAGGFVCVPGSHKTNFLRSVPAQVRRLEEHRDYVHQPALRAGDVLLFTEALIHGTAPWTADHERRTLLFKYSPPHSSWAKTPYDPRDYPEASEQQRRLMAPASIEDHLPVTSVERGG